MTKKSEASGSNRHAIEKIMIREIVTTFRRLILFLIEPFSLKGFRATITPSKNSHTLACGAKYVKVPNDESFDNGSTFMVSRKENKIIKERIKFWSLFEFLRMFSQIRKKNRSGYMK